MARCSNVIMGMVIAHGRGSFFFATAVCDFNDPDGGFSLEKMVIDPDTFECDWMGPEIAISCLRIASLTQLGSTSARIKYFASGSCRSVEISGAKPRFLAKLYRAVAGELTGVR